MVNAKTSLELWAAHFLMALPFSLAAGCSSPTPCGSSTAVAVDGKDTGLATCDSGIVHRAKAATCPTQNVCMTPGINGGCSSDTECAASGGHCVQASPNGCACEASCSSDTDCGKNQLCECSHGDPNSFPGTSSQCVAAACHSDADCTDGVCASYVQLDQNGCATGHGFACQTNADECTLDADCKSGGVCGMSGGHRICATGGFNAACCTPEQIAANACGRPFLVNETNRTAKAHARTDWLARVEPSVVDLSERERAELAIHWTNVGLMEHASIAAFARFALQLLSVGAPPDLVRDAQEAMRDETEHARLAFGLASAYAGEAVGPGRLRLDGALDDADERSILVMVIREGCIGETLAALEANEALAHTTDPAVRAVLAVIADDERRHALLAWRYVAWAMERDVVSVRAICESELQRAAVLPRMATARSAHLDRGVLGTALEVELRRSAVQQVIRPSFEALLGANNALALC